MIYFYISHYAVFYFMLIKCENKVWKVTFQLDKDNYTVVWDTPCSVKYIYSAVPL